MLDNSWRWPVTTLALFLGCSAGAPDNNTLPDSSSGGTIDVGQQGGTNGIAGNAVINPPPGAGGSAGTVNGSGGIQGGVMCEGLGKSLKGLLRDFQAETNPDFEPQLGAKGATAVNADDPGIVSASIDPTSMKPMYAGGPSGTVTTYGPSSFDSWFRDTPGINKSIEYSLEFSGPDANGVYTFDPGSTGFLPIDDGAKCPAMPQTPCLFGNTTLMGNTYPHNYSMTFELHTNFIYKAGMQFTFSGDDDVWVYINNALVLDLGGTHPKETKTVNLDVLGLTAMSTYRLDFFWAERHLTQSNFRIDTSLEFVDCGLEVVR